MTVSRFWDADGMLTPSGSRRMSQRRRRGYLRGYVRRRNTFVWQEDVVDRAARIVGDHWAGGEPCWMVGPDCPYEQNWVACKHPGRPLDHWAGFHFGHCNNCQRALLEAVYEDGPYAEHAGLVLACGIWR